MSSIYLIRHGMTEANLRHLYCGSTDLPLSDAGAKALADLSSPIHANRYVTSGMKRTNQTLSLLLGDVPFTEDPQLREVDFGVFEMHSYNELKDREDYQLWLSGCNEENTPPGGESGAHMTRRVMEAFRRYAMHSYNELKDREDYQLWLSGCNEENTPPGGESGAHMTRRVMEAFRRYAALDEDVVLVTHGGVIAAIMAQLFPEDGKNRYQWQPLCGHGYLLRDGSYQAF